ncbi:MAG TPA: DUF3185 family protein [Planctomycetota bacterium]|nr:DUF3185 family protein [Planctomycetota bacterium]
MNKIVSAILLVGGLALAGFGYRASESVASETKEAFSGLPTQTAMIFMIGGAIVALVGLVGLLRRPRTA